MQNFGTAEIKPFYRPDAFLLLKKTIASKH